MTNKGLYDSRSFIVDARDWEGMQGVPVAVARDAVWLACTGAFEGFYPGGASKDAMRLARRLVERSRKHDAEYSHLLSEEAQRAERRRQQMLHGDDLV